MCSLRNNVFFLSKNELLCQIFTQNGKHLKRQLISNKVNVSICLTFEKNKNTI